MLPSTRPASNHSFFFKNLAVTTGRCCDDEIDLFEATLRTQSRFPLALYRPLIESRVHCNVEHLEHPQPVNRETLNARTQEAAARRTPGNLSEQSSQTASWT